MVKLLAKIKRHLPLRISLMITMALSLLLMVILIITLFYSRKTMKEEALNRASTTLEKVQTNIDNILLSVEESAGNMYFNMKFDDPERMYVYARKIVENNPYVTGCAIAFKPGIYNRPHFMAYEHYKGGGYRALGQVPIVRSETFGTKPYTEQVWFTRPMKEGYPMWINPLHGMETDIDPLITYSLPMPGFDGKPIGVIAVDVSLKLLSDVVAAAKPSPTSYCVLLDSKGSIIVHPLGGEKFNFTAPNMHSQSLMDAVNRMMSGDTGFVPFQVEDRKYHLFYKPFEQAKVPNRSMGKWGWSVGLAYSEEDIFVNRMYHVPIAFETELSDDFCILTNRRYLLYSLQELLGNATRYSDGKNVLLRVEKDDKSVRFIIQDTGKGIAEADLENIFMFFTKVDDFSDGLGLGLPLVKRHAETLGGSFTLDTSYHAGCRFIFELPI